MSNCEKKKQWRQQQEQKNNTHRKKNPPCKTEQFSISILNSITDRAHLLRMHCFVWIYWEPYVLSFQLNFINFVYSSNSKQQHRILLTLLCQMTSDTMCFQWHANVWRKRKIKRKSHIHFTQHNNNDLLRFLQLSKSSNHYSQFNKTQRHTHTPIHAKCQIVHWTHPPFTSYALCCNFVFVNFFCKKKIFFLPIEIFKNQIKFKWFFFIRIAPSFYFDENSFFYKNAIKSQLNNKKCYF